MSYDVNIVCSHGHEAWWGNMTTNVAPMWRQAGADLAEFDGKNTDDPEILDALRKAIGALELHPLVFEQMEPRNGWGSVQGCRAFLETILAKCEEFPGHQFAISR